MKKLLLLLGFFFWITLGFSQSFDIIPEENHLTSISEPDGSGAGLSGYSNPVPPPGYREQSFKTGRSSFGYGWNAVPSGSGVPAGPVRISLATGALMSLKEVPSSQIWMSGAEMVEDQWFAVSGGTTNSGLYVIDITTGDYQLIGFTGVSLGGLAYNAHTGMLYGSTDSGWSKFLYRINTQTAQVTSIGVIAQNIAIFGIAADATGNLYGITGNSELISINPQTGQSTVIGPLGVTLSFAQDIAFDKDNNVLYGTLYSQSTGGLYTINTQTGEATLIHNFLAEVTGFAIPYSLAADGAPAALENFTVLAGAEGAMQATANWTNPTLTFDGFNLTQIDSVVLLRNHQYLASVSGSTPGQTQSFTDTSPVNAGLYNYRAFAVNQQGAGAKTSYNLFIGEDVPAAPDNLTLTAQDDYGYISWDAPTQGLNGGYLSGENITYTIVRFPQQTTVATDITGTEFLDTTLPGRGNYWYRVTAKNHKGTGGMATTHLTLLAGKGYLMFEEFNYTAGQQPPQWFRVGVPHTWRLQFGNDAGGVTPQLGIHWDPPTQGVSRYVSYPVPTKGHSSLRYRFKNFLYNSLAGHDAGEIIGADVTWDNGETFVPLWDTLIGPNHIAARTREFFIDVPEGKESFRIAYRFEGNSQFINWWSIDDITIEPWFVNDLRAASIDGSVTPLANQQSIFTVNVENFGSTAQSNFTVKLMKNDSILIGSLPGVTLAPGQVLGFDIPWTPTNDDLGEVSLTGVVELEGDQNEFNNTTQPLKVWVQTGHTVIIPIGEGTALQGLPIAFHNHASLAQTLYFPNEIGMPGGAISGIKFFNNFDNTLSKPIKIFLGETDATDLRGGWVDPTSLQLVFDGTVLFPVGENEIYIHFDNTYDYQGGNLVVYISKFGTQWSNHRNFYNTEAPGSARSRRAVRSSTPYNPLAPEQPGLLMNFFPNTVFYIDGSGTGSLQGNITSNNDPMEDVKVSLLGTNLVKFSDEAGNYTFPYAYPGTYSVEFSKFSFYDKLIENVVIELDQATIVNAALTPLPVVSVSGLITGSDLPEVGLDSVHVMVSGYNGYEVYTDENGNFIIEGVFGEKTYNLSLFHPRYLPYSGTITVGTADLDLGTIVLDENPLPVREVLAIETETGAHISWQEPQLHPVREFRYDDGEAYGMLGFTNGNLNSVMGSAHHNIAELYEVSWKLVNPNFQHATVRIRVLGLTAQGLPDRTQVIYDASNVPNTHFEWTTHVFPDTLHAPNGFYIGLSATNNLGLAMDDGEGPLWPFVPMRHFGISNITNTGINFTPVENWNHPRNFLLRANGRDFGAIDYGIKEYVAEYSDDVMPDLEFSVVDHHIAAEFDLNGRGQKALEGFSVYRFLVEDFHNEEEWTEIASNISEWEFVDTDWPNLPIGAYIFSVVAHYSNGVNSVPAFSNMLPKDMFVSFTVNLTTNSGDNPQGAVLTLVNQTGNEDHVYTAIAQEDGTAFFAGVWRGTYTLTIDLPGFELFVQEDLAVDEHDLSFDAELIEIIKRPFGLVVETENQQVGDARLTWRVNPEFFEGFEGQFPPLGWKKMNPDGGTGWMQLGANTTPLPGWTGGVAIQAPGGGNYMAYVTYIHGGAHHNDQWLVTPELVAVEDFDFSFFIRKHPLHYIDNVDIRISTTVQDDPAAFDILVHTLTFPSGTPDAWVKHTFDLNQFVEPGTSFYIAFREHVQNNQTQGSGIMLDNVHYGPEGRNFAHSSNPVFESTEEIGRDLSGNYYYGPAPKNLKAFLGYNIFLNDLEDPIAEGVMVEEYLFSNLPEGAHMAGVQSVFTTGVSEIVTRDFTIVFPPPVFQLSFNVKDQDGNTISDARITLDGVQYAPGVYVFNDLLAGTYAYTVSKAGYSTVSGAAVIVDQDLTVQVIMEEVIPETYTLTFVVKDELDNPIADAVISLNGSQNAPGDYVFADLDPGTYAYTALRDGYYAASGQVIISNADVVHPIVLIEIPTPDVFLLTLKVDMTNAEGFDPDAHEVFVSGNFGDGMNWTVPGTHPDLKLAREGQSMHFAIILELEGGVYQYKYASTAFGQGWDGAEWVGDPNRSVTLNANKTLQDIWGIHPDDLGMSELADMFFSVYPNPASSTLYINSLVNMISIEMLDLSGRRIYTSLVSGQVAQIDASQFKDGVYFLKINTPAGTFVKKVQIIK